MDIALTMPRNQWLWRGVSPKSVGEYLKQLRREQKRFDDGEFALPRPFRLSDDARCKVLTLIDDEIRLAEFYFELRGRRKEPDFDQWVFVQREDRQPQGWREPTGDVWVRSNGRLKAEIEIDRTRTMVRVSLRLQNDSDQLIFYLRDGGREICHRFLRNKASIESEVARLKQHAESEIQRHLLPCRAQCEQDILGQLLHVD